MLMHVLYLNVFMLLYVLSLYVCLMVALCHCYSFLVEEMMAKHAEMEGFSESHPQGGGPIRHLSKDDESTEVSNRCSC